MSGDIRIAAAFFYPHEEEARLGPPEESLTRLTITGLSVDTDVRTEGMVTLGASGPDPASDAYGIELELTPAAARVLGTRLLGAADRCEGSR